MVKRYEPEEWGGLHMTPSEDGCCVMFEDYEELRQLASELVLLAEPSDTEEAKLVRRARELLALSR